MDFIKFVDVASLYNYKHHLFYQCLLLRRLENEVHHGIAMMQPVPLNLNTTRLFYLVLFQNVFKNKMSSSCTSVIFIKTDSTRYFPLQ